MSIINYSSFFIYLTNLELRLNFILLLFYLNSNDIYRIEFKLSIYILNFILIESNGDKFERDKFETLTILNLVHI